MKLSRLPLGIPPAPYRICDPFMQVVAAMPESPKQKLLWQRLLRQRPDLKRLPLSAGTKIPPNDAYRFIDWGLLKPCRRRIITFLVGALY